MANKVEIKNVFPCAKAPWDNGTHTLWTEYNITNIFNFLFDVGDVPILSADGSQMAIHGYIFSSEGTFTEGNPYYIIVDSNGELVCAADSDNAILYDEEPAVPTTWKVYGGVAQKIKFTQPSLGDLNFRSGS